MRSGTRVVSPVTSSGCGRPITKSFRPEQLLSESLLESIGKTRQTSQRVVPCGQWFLPNIHWHPGTLTSVSVCRQRCVQRVELSASSLPPIFLVVWSFCVLLPSPSPKHLIPPPTVSTSALLQYFSTGPLTCPSLFSFSFFFLPKQFPFFSNETFFYQPITILTIMEGKALKVYLSLADL